MFQNYRLIILSIILLTITIGISEAENRTSMSGEIKRSIQTEGSCAIVGMSAEQSQLVALQRARTSAIEKAAGLSVSSSILVTNYTVAVDFIKTYAKGFIISEQVTWLPIGQYQKNQSTAPIPEYRVQITADIYVPQKKIKPFLLEATLNNTVFRTGEKANVTVKSTKEVNIAIFNIMANDTVSMLFPNQYETNNLISPKDKLLFPNKNSIIELEMITLPGHEKDAEAFFVVATERSQDVNFMNMFAMKERMNLNEFFKILSDIVDYSEDVILPYEIVGKNN